MLEHSCYHSLPPLFTISISVSEKPRMRSAVSYCNCNSLPPVLRDPDISLLQFRQLLKTFLFSD